MGSPVFPNALMLMDDVPFEPGDDAVVAALMAELTPVEPSPAVRAAVVEAARGPGRLHRFAERLAALVDVSVDKAKELLDRVADTTRWEKDLFPGMDALWVEGGPAVAQCIRGFARLEAGRPFPTHAHLGDETTLVLEGAMLESGGADGSAARDGARVVRPGETLTMAGGSEHHYMAASGGTDLLFFVVVRRGLGFADGGELLHRDG